MPFFILFSGPGLHETIFPRIKEKSVSMFQLILVEHMLYVLHSFHHNSFKSLQHHSSQLSSSTLWSSPSQDHRIQCTVIMQYHRQHWLNQHSAVQTVLSNSVHGVSGTRTHTHKLQHIHIHSLWCETMNWIYSCHVCSHSRGVVNPG